MLLLFYYETWVYVAKCAILSKIFCCSLNVLLFPIWTIVHSKWKIKADKMVFLCQNLGERIKWQRIIVRTLGSFFRQFSVWKPPLIFLVVMPHSLLVELLTTRSPTDPAGAWIYAPISVNYSHHVPWYLYCLHLPCQLLGEQMTPRAAQTPLVQN